MTFLKLTKTFHANDTGAVTVDWVVLAAAIVGLGLAVYAVVSPGIKDLSTDIDTQLDTNQIKTTFE